MGQPGEFSSLSGSKYRDSEIPRLGPARRGGIFAATGRRLSAWPAVGPPPSDADFEPNVAADVEIPHQVIHLVLRRCPTPSMVGNLVIVFQCSAPASPGRSRRLVYGMQSSFFDTGITEPGWLSTLDFRGNGRASAEHSPMAMGTGIKPVRAVVTRARRSHRSPAKVWNITSRCPSPRWHARAAFTALGEVV